MSFFDVANSRFLFAAVGIGILYVIGFAVFYGFKSYSRAVEVGVPKEKLREVMRSSAVFTVVPSLAIVLGFFSLAALLGIAWPWFRLSVIGSVTYEIMAADSALKTLGIVSPSAASGRVFVTLMYVMTICIMGGVILSIFVAKRIQRGTMELKAKDERWGSLAMSTFMTTIMVVFLVPIILKGGTYLMTLITSAVITAVLGLIARKFQIKWLEGFILAISLIVAMASSVLWSGIFNTAVH